MIDLKIPKPKVRGLSTLKTRTRTTSQVQVQTRDNAPIGLTLQSGAFSLNAIVTCLLNNCNTLIKICIATHSNPTSIDRRM